MLIVRSTKRLVPILLVIALVMAMIPVLVSDTLVYAAGAISSMGTNQDKAGTSPWSAVTSLSFNAGDYVIVCEAADSRSSSVKLKQTSPSADIALTNDAGYGTDGGTAAVITIWRAEVTITGSAFYVELTNTSTAKAVTVYKLTGLITGSSPKDIGSGGTGSGTTAATGSSGTLAQNDEIVVVASAHEDEIDDANGTWSTATNYIGTNVQFNATNGGSDATNIQVHSAAGVVSATTAQYGSDGTHDSSDWAAAIVSYKIQTSAPSAPSNLARGGGTSTTLEASWTSGSGSYRMLRYDTSTYPTTTSAGTLGFFGSGTSTTLNGLSAGQAYYCSIWEYNGLYSSSYDTELMYTLPGNPSALAESAQTSTSITMGFTKGTGGDKTMVRYRTDTYPTGTSDGTQAYFDTGTSTGAVGSLSPGQIYYWRAWAYDSDSTYYSASYSQDTAYTRPGDPSALALTTPGSTSLGLSWTGGTGGDTTVVRYGTSTYPTSISDGFPVYFGTGSSCTTNGISDFSQTTSNQEAQMLPSGYSRIGEVFSNFPSTTISEVQIYLAKVDAPIGTGYCRIRNSSTDAIIGTVGSIDVSTISSSGQWVVFNTTPVVISVSNIIVTFEYSPSSGQDIKLYYNSAGSLSEAKYAYYVGTWSESSLSDLKIIVTTTISAFSPNTTYYFRSWAYDSDSGLYSSGTSDLTQGTGPTAPTGLTAPTKDDDQIDLSYSPPSETENEETSTSSNGSSERYDTFWMGQSFTASRSYRITGVILKLYRVGNPGTCTVSIRATTSDLPSGADLISTTFNGNALTTDTSGSNYTYSFSSSYLLNASTMYAIVLRAPSGDVSNALGWRMDNGGNPYSYGTQCYSNTAGVSWVKYDANDHVFTTIGYITTNYMVRYSTSAYPTSITDGTQGYYGSSITPTVSSLSAGQIYYIRVWSRNSSDYYGDYASITDYTRPSAPTSLAETDAGIDDIHMSWTKGTGGDKTTIRISSSTYPTTISEGIEAYALGTGTSTTVSGSLLSDTSITVGEILTGSSYTRCAESITSFPITTINYVKWKIYKTGELSGTIYARVRKVSDDSIIGTIGTLDIATVGLSSGWYTFNSSPVSNTSVQDLYFTIEYSSGSWLVITYDDNNSFSGGVGYSYDGSYNAQDDLLFEIGYGAMIVEATTYYLSAWAYDTDSGYYSTGYDTEIMYSLYPPNTLASPSQTSTSIDLSWTNGAQRDTTMVRIKDSGYPSSTSDGEQVYNSTGTTATASTYGGNPLNSGTTYYFRAWSYDSTDTEYTVSYVSLTQATSASSYAITNTPSSKDFGVVADSTTYYAKGTAPNNPVVEGDTTFTLSNTGLQCDIDANITDFTGGTSWNIVATSPSTNEIRVTIYYVGQDPASGLVLSNTDQEWIDAFAASTHVHWDLKIEFGILTDEGNQHTAIITLTAVAED